ncbi:hypothetical protein PAPYR_2207 [Paratrimastix pyriformis]|uniref:Uncharacterized protein n=1 Tax=Paratrimastix pyriformis TaxID=342808 RepID=A0ABQ8UPU6_9EUKA|nr:hypothetical protein PAPYR_2207 [Paratrimastix pyriformis]
MGSKGVRSLLPLRRAGFVFHCNTEFDVFFAEVLRKYGPFQDVLQMDTQAWMRLQMSLTWRGGIPHHEDKIAILILHPGMECAGR